MNHAQRKAREVFILFIYSFLHYSEVSSLSLLKQMKTLHPSSLAPITSAIYTHYKTHTICIISFICAEKPPDDRWQRQKFFIDKQKFIRYHRLYGNSLTGGVDRAKTIIVTKTDAKKKKGKNKEPKMVSAWSTHEFLIPTLIFILLRSFTWGKLLSLGSFHSNAFSLVLLKMHQKLYICARTIVFAALTWVQ